MNHFVKWMKCAAIRAAKTFAQTMVGGITVGAAMHEVNWGAVASVAAVAAVCSILTSVGGLPEVQEDEQHTIGDASDDDGK